VNALFLSTLFFLSGAASLVYEVAWTRALGLLAGTTAVATSAVLAAFMGGLGAGAAAGGALARRARRPLAAYGAVELLVALLAALVPYGLRALEAAPPGAALPLGAGLVALPAALMGASFPLACAAGAGRPGAAALYGWNTLGAVAGTVAAAFALLPGIGLAKTQSAAAGVSLAVGVAAIAAGMRRSQGRRPLAPTPAAGPPAGIALAAGLSGAAGLLLEVVHARVLALVLGGSVYAFATMLAAFLAGIALGSLGLAAAGKGRGDCRDAGGGSDGEAGAMPGRRRAAAAALAATALAAFGTAFLVPELPYRFVVLHARLGASPAVEAALAGAVSLVPAVGLGAGFAALLRAAPPGAAGGLYARNTLGAIAGAVLGGLYLIPAVGLPGTIAVACGASLLAAAAALGAPLAWPAAAVLGGALALFRPAFPPAVLATGAFAYADILSPGITRAAFLARLTPSEVEIVRARDGRTSTVTVERVPAANTVYLKNNGKVDGSVPIDPARPSAGADMPTQVMLAAAPLALAERPRRALVIGLGSGVTAGAALAFPLERLDIVEIEPEVARALRETTVFDAANGQPLDDPRARLAIDDARSLLRRAAPGSYEAVISQPADPWLTGVANLFTREFFALGRRALAPDGLFCQWVQLYGLDLDGLRTIVATFRTAFPEVLALHPRGTRELLLVGGARPFAIEPAAVARRLEAPRVAAMLRAAGLRTVEEVLGQVVAATADIDAFAAGAPINTDDSGLVEFRAPRTRFLPPAEAERAFEALAGSPRGLAAAFAPLPADARIALSEGAAAIGHFAAARAWLRTLGDGAQVHRRLGDLARARGDAAGALLEWGEALKRDPGDRSSLERIIRLREQLGGR
jgi:predicted membrane-bound spermidine synthase